MLKKEELPECPVATVVHLIGNKWKLLIIRNLLANTSRFNELQKGIPGISQKVLTDNLRALEAAGLNLSGTKLVVLSACDTGLGDTTNGQGVYGLRRALAISGAESQLISLWAVDTYKTQTLMVNYYKRLMSNVGRSQALRQTQLEMLQKPESQHPYYWAPFIPSGDWTAMGL